MTKLKISLASNQHDFGEYNSNSDTITIFIRNHKSLKSLIKTFYHELYHVYEDKFCLPSSEFYAKQFEKFSKDKKLQHFATKTILKAILKSPNPISLKIPTFVSKRIKQEIKKNRL
jgi:hypothetical protein